MTVDEVTSGFRSREDLKRLYFRCLKCYSSVMNPLDSGWFGVYCGFQSRKTDMAAAISNFTSHGGDFVRLSCGRRPDDEDGRSPFPPGTRFGSYAELELALTASGYDV